MKKEKQDTPANLLRCASDIYQLEGAKRNFKAGLAWANISLLYAKQCYPAGGSALKVFEDNVNNLKSQ
jgi:hypothetical protein